MNIKNVHIKLTLWMLAILLITISQPVSGQAAWTSSGPPGGYVNSISFSPSDEGVVYAGTISGVYKSTDGGEQWSFAGLGGLKVNKVLVDPKNADIIYGLVDIEIENGFYKSIDGGNDWAQLDIDLVLVMDIDKNNSDILWAGTNAGKIFKSNDYGENWTKVFHKQYITYSYSQEDDEWQANYHDQAVTSILIDTEDSNTIFASFDRGGDKAFAKSKDGGETWTEKKVGRISPNSARSLIITPRGHTPQTLYIIAPIFSEDNVYFSTDKGETWTSLGVSDMVESEWGHGTNARTICVDLSNPDWIFIGTSYANADSPLIAINNSEGIWTDDIGNGLPKFGPTCLAVNPFEPEKILAGYTEGSLYKTADDGKNWEEASTGINNSFIRDLAVHPQLSNSVYAAIDGTHPIQKTEDEGATWTEIEKSPLNANTIAFDTNNPSVIFAGNKHIHRSIDGGESWTDIHSLSYREIKDIWVNPSNPNIVLVIADQRSTDWYTYYGGVWRNTDGGTSDEWNFVFKWWRPECLTSDPNNHNHVYLGVERIGYVYYSPDAGLSWYNISPGNNYWYNVNDLVVDSKTNIYAATTKLEENEKDGIWKMEWKSDTTFLWSHVYRFEGTEVTALAIDRRTDPATLYAGTSDSGVFVSQDGGESWSEFNYGLGIKKITKLEISATEPKMLYAGTEYGGVWSILLAIENLIITAQVGENGNISPTDDVEVEYGDTQVFNIVPDEGYRVAYIRIDGNEIDLATDENWNAESGEYTFSNVTENHTIEVGFEDATSIGIENKNEIKVYPNPTSNNLWIEFYHQGNEKLVIVLQNQQGQTVRQVSVNQTGSLRVSMPTQNLASGVYLLTIQGKKAFPVKRVMIEN